MLIYSQADPNEEGTLAPFTKTQFTWAFAPGLERRQQKMFQSPEFSELLQKWDILPRCQFGAFRYDQRFDAHLSTAKADFAFLQSLFDSAVFRQKFNGLVSNGFCVRNFERLSASVVNMNVFDIFRKHGAVYGKDNVAICPEVLLDNGIICENQLKRCLFDEQHDGFNEFDHNEFIVQLMKMVVLGGSFCQYEDKFQTYASVVKTLYKGLVNVIKTADGEIKVTSAVYRVRDRELFPEAPLSCWNRCYVIVDSVVRQASFLRMPRSDSPW